MPLQRLTSTDAFVVTDLDGAPHADGVVRWAKKVLIDGGRTMARARTYSWALLEQQVSGASAGISAAPDTRDEAIAAFTGELSDAVAAGALSLDPAKGVRYEDLAALDAVDTRSPLLRTTTDTGPLADTLLGEGIVGAAAAVLGGLDGRTVAIEGAGATGPSIAAAVAAGGGRVAALGTSLGTVVVEGSTDDLVAEWVEHGEALVSARGPELPASAVLTLEADVLVCGSKLGPLDHDVAGTLAQRVVAPCGPAPVTARGLAVARRHDVVVLPDFLTTIGPLLAFHPEEGATVESLRAAAAERTAQLVGEVLDHEDGPYLGAAVLAERYLSTWQDELPFGRPLA